MWQSDLHIQKKSYFLFVINLITRLMQIFRIRRSLKICGTMHLSLFAKKIIKYLYFNSKYTYDNQLCNCVFYEEKFNIGFGASCFATTCMTNVFYRMMSNLMSLLMNEQTKYIVSIVTCVKWDNKFVKAAYCIFSILKYLLRKFQRKHIQSNHTDAIVMATNLTQHVTHRTTRIKHFTCFFFGTQHCKYLQNTTVVQHIHCVGV